MTTVSSGHTLTISAGQTSSGIVVLSGGFELVDSGGVASGSVLSGGHETVSFGGTAIGTVVSTGGLEWLSSGASISTTVNSGGKQEVDYGTASATIVNSGGYQEVFSSTVTGTKVDGGYQLVEQGATAIATAINSGGLQLTVLGATSGTTVNSGGLQVVADSAVATGTTINSGGTLELIGAGVLVNIGGISGVNPVAGSAAGTTVDNGALVFDLSPTAPSATTMSANLTGSGSLVVEGGGTLVVSGGDAFTGDVTISGGVLELSSAGAAGTGSVIFAPGSNATLQIDDLASAPAPTPGPGGPAPTPGPGGPAPTPGPGSGPAPSPVLASAPAPGVQTDFNRDIVGFAAGDVIRVEGFGGFPTIDHATPTFDAATNRTSLVLTDGSATVATLHLTGDYSSDTFTAATDAKITSAMDIAFCFMPGTGIRTPHGEIAVESLKRGDLVTTTDGHSVPVRWIGRQTVSTVFGDPLRILPIRIKAGALGPDVPSRDLLLSPDHALLIDGVLIQAGALVNGTTVVRETNVPETFTYYHIELDDHSLILAENAPAETFVDNVDRLAFDNWQEYERLYPEGKSVVEMAYPRAKAYRQVPQAIRAKLAMRAASLAGTGDHLVA
jgi:autotransporter passenger strand-loop-strand repeat protein/autotransporter-associated beta strand protein